MSLYKTKAIILRVIKYNEADKILNLLAPEGRIGAIAKGSRKVQSRFGGRIEPFCQVDLVLYKGKNLHTITQAVLINSYKNIRQDYPKYIIATAAVELIDKVTFSGQTEEKLFSLLEKMLDHLNSKVPANLLTLIYFNWQVIRVLGLLPDIPLTPHPSTLTCWFNLKEGVLVDRSLSDDNCLKIEALTMDLLKSIINVDFEGILNFNPSKQTLAQLSFLTEQYLSYQLQIKLKSRSYIESINL